MSNASENAEWIEDIWETIADALADLGFELNSREETEKFVSDLPCTGVVAEEPEWEHAVAYSGDMGAIATFSSALNADVTVAPNLGDVRLRRRKAGPWEPVG